MRLRSSTRLTLSLLTAGVCVALASIPRPAFADAGKLGETSKERDASPASSGSGPSSGNTSEPPEGVVDRLGNKTQPLSSVWWKRFHYEAGWEMHGFLVQNNLLGAGNETLFNYFYASISYDITQHDKVAFTAGLYRYALADPDETSGFRADDLLFSYDHRFELPWEVGMDVTLSAIAPTSFDSHIMGLVTAPRLKVGVDRTFFKHITVNPRVFGEWYWQQYTSQIGGSTPNPVGRIGVALGLSAELPWHTPLSAGINLYTGYQWFYMPDGSPPNPNLQYMGTENNPTFKVQPVQQSYGEEVYVRYDFKPIYGVSSWATFAYANGDPTAGYNGLLVDGVSQLYLFYPEASQLYGTLGFKY